MPLLGMWSAHKPQLLQEGLVNVCVGGWESVEQEREFLTHPNLLLESLLQVGEAVEQERANSFG